MESINAITLDGVLVNMMKTTTEKGLWFLSAHTSEHVLEGRVTSDIIFSSERESPKSALTLNWKHILKDFQSRSCVHEDGQSF